MTRLTVRLRIDFGPGCALGPGKIDLLECIERTGSLSAAAAEMEMSYKCAWDLLQSLNGLYDRPIVVMSKGGRGGGGATLTDRGREVVAAFRRAERRCSKVTEEAFDGLLPVSPRSTVKEPVRRLSVKTASRRA